MKLLERLLHPGTDWPADVPLVRDWTCYFVEKRSVRLAIRKNAFGGPYAPPSLSEAQEAEVFLLFDDGRCARASLGRAEGEADLATLRHLHASAFCDPYPDTIPGPRSPAPVNIFDHEVRDRVEHHPESLFEPLLSMHQVLKRLPTDQIRAHLEAHVRHVRFASSRGADASFDETLFDYGANLDSTAGFDHTLRILPREEEVQARLERVMDDLEALSHPSPVTLNAPTVVMAPGVVQSFLRFYLLPALSLQVVINGNAGVTLADLEAQRQWLHPDLSLLDDSGMEGAPFAIALDRRGQSGTRRALIKDGRLVGADVSLRAATQSGWAPTPTLLTDNLQLEGLKVHQPPSGTRLADHLAPLENAIYIFSVLGLHTQDSPKGSYSLGVSRGLAVKDGVPLGYARGTIQGNFLTDLRQNLRAFPDLLTSVPALELKSRWIEG